jgi:hypothetical protein
MKFIKTKVNFPQTWVTVANVDYPVLFAPKDF